MAVVTAESIVLALLVVLVAGLLRSHAEILRTLHDHGIGVGDPAGAPASGSGAPAAAVAGPARRLGPPVGAGGAGGALAPSAYDLAGSTPAGEVVAVGVGSRPTLLAFLSSGCGTCAGFWQALAQPGPDALEPYRIVVVTMGADQESPGALARLQPPGLPVVMSSQAWADYAVPGSPYFVVIEEGRVVGQGTASSWAQLVSLYGQAAGERVDRELAAAGITPGDPRLYPERL